MCGIRSWPSDDRPRERLIRCGEHNLSDTELLAIILCSGTTGQSAIDLARNIIQRFRTFRNMSCVDLLQWKECKGLGIAKIAQIKAALEIGRRFGEQELKHRRPNIKSSKEIADILMTRMGNLKKEVVKIVLLDVKNRVIDIIEITEGSVTDVKPVMREIFHKTLQHHVTSIICVHNHPSGDVKPSADDKKFTRALVASGKLLQVIVLDHIIIGNNKFFSFADKGLM